MHGVSRAKRTDKQCEEEQKKIAHYRGLVEAMMAMRSANQLDKESLALNTKVLSIGAEFYTAWNFRRKILLNLFRQAQPHEIACLCEAEVLLGEAALARNSKVYCVWSHRLWCLQQPHNGIDLDRELQLCSQFLRADERNFHCWSYRRRVVELIGLSVESQLAFTKQKIDANFSNYSAWHYRSILLAQGVATRESLAKEFDLVQQAFFTDPNDQSAWLYHRWLLQKLRHAFGDGEYQTQLQADIVLIRELAQVEPNCKWVMLSLCELLRLQDASRHAAELECLLARCRELDPLRTEFYTDACHRRIELVPAPAYQQTAP